MKQGESFPIAFVPALYAAASEEEFKGERQLLWIFQINRLWF